MRTANRQIFRIAPALLVLAIALLQPAPEAFADVSVQDKEVLEAVEKVAPTIEEIGKKLWGLSEVSLRRPPTWTGRLSGLRVLMIPAFDQGAAWY